MPVRGVPARLLRWLGVLCAGVLAVLGGLGMEPAGRVSVGVAGLLAGCIAAAITRDAPGNGGRSVVESAVQTAAWTVGALLTLAGVAVLAGGVLAVMAAAAVGTWLVIRATRSSWRSGAARTTPPWPANGVEVLFLPVPPPGSPRGSAPTVGTAGLAALPTPALGREWLRTTEALRGRLSPAERQALVRRRAETLDELERRDPAGFARWLAGGPAPGTDPADYVHGRPVHDDPAAGSDAA